MTESRIELWDATEPCASHVVASVARRGISISASVVNGFHGGKAIL
jgi:hypothetical protein